MKEDKRDAAKALARSSTPAFDNHARLQGGEFVRTAWTKVLIYLLELPGLEIHHMLDSFHHGNSKEIQVSHVLRAIVLLCQANPKAPNQGLHMFQMMAPRTCQSMSRHPRSTS